MKKLVLLLTTVFFLVMAHAQHTPWRPGEMEVKIIFHQTSDASRLASLHLNTDFDGGCAVAYLIPSELEILKQSGFDFQVLKPDLNAWSASFGSALVPPGYYTFSKIESIADSLVTNFPAICKKVVYGYNAQLQELAALKISDNASLDEAEPEILFDGGIHGDEVGGSQNVIQFARDLCLGYGSDPQITGLVDNREIWLYYCVNPYGRDNMTRYNSSTVDINRDFGYMWGAEGGSPGLFSQPESKALRNCQFDNQFVAYTNYHSGTEIISYPWSYRYSPAPDRPSIENLAQLYSASSGYSSFPYGQGSVVMYLIEGSTKDFNYGCLGSVAWSIEISLEKQPADVQYYYNINKPAMLALIEHVGYGIQGMITDAITGKPVAASVYVATNYPVYSDPKEGDFHKYLLPGTYTLKIAANGYSTQTIPNITVNNLACTTIDVQMQPLASQFGYRVMASHIPAFNAQDPGDEGYTAACLGAPDNVNYSLGRGGYVIVDMQDTIFDGEPGTNDIAVYEGDSSPEGYTLYSGTTPDGPWINLGYATSSSSFDLQPFGVSNARYFMILDDNNGQMNVNDAGFDFDAIACLHPAIPDTVGHLSGYVYNAFTHLPLEGAAVSWADTSVFSDGTGYYYLDVNRGTDIVCAALEEFRSECDTLSFLPAQVDSHDFYLFPNVGIQVEASENQFLKLAPNPFTTDFDLSFFLPVPSNFIIEIFDMCGKRISIYEKLNAEAGLQCINGKFLLEDINLLKPGSYVLVIQTPGMIFRKKLIKA